MKMNGLRFALGCHSSPGLKAWVFLAWFISAINATRSHPFTVKIILVKNIYVKL
jgi:hypothetical protein